MKVLMENPSYKPSDNQNIYKSWLRETELVYKHGYRFVINWTNSIAKDLDIGQRESIH